MNKHFQPLTKLLILSLILVFTSGFYANSYPPKRELYELRIYHLSSQEQESRVDTYLKNAFLPALHRAGIKKAGVFKPVETDTTFGKRIFVLIPYNSADQFMNLSQTLQKDKQHTEAGKDYLDALHSNAPYTRIESMLLQAFKDMPQLEVPDIKTPRNERVYELRSYEGHTEKIYANKVHMFNEGGEINIFKKLGFNAVFYAEVLIGPRMPNLMYMTTFENQASRDAHWKAFTDDADWKKLSSRTEYKNNVSKSTTYFLRPTSYSDI
jgi:hypothetical protein